jgi:hypothetical protein
MPIELYPAETTSISWYKQIPNLAYFRGDPSDSRFTWDFMLLSQFYFSKINPRVEYDINSRVKLMGDSGGYQILTQQVATEPLHVLNWLEEYCSVGMTLDVPPDDKGAKDHLYFLKCLERTEHYVETMARHRSQPSSTPYELQLLNVIQGENTDDVEIWLGRMIEYQNSLDGFAFPYRAGLPLEFIIWVVGKLLEEKPARLHLLSATGLTLMPLLCYISRSTKTIISVDSTSHALPASKHKFVLPGGTRIRIGQDESGINEMPCKCVICRNVEIEDIKVSRGSALGILASHNLNNLVEWLHMSDVLMREYSCAEAFLGTDAHLLHKARYLIENGADSYKEKFLDDGKDMRRFF